VEKGAQLIVTVDCGTTSFEALAPQHRGKTDVLVIDHHQADEQLPEVSAVVPALPPSPCPTPSTTTCRVVE
ncbi:MAG: hypothetical protein J0I75_00675, partial [Hyphomicrobium sp.]|nr:hypothetical protein [Hyphomicrobium sp.]